MARELAPDATIMPDVEHVISPDGAGVVLATPSKTHLDLKHRTLQAATAVLADKLVTLRYQEALLAQTLVGQVGRVLMAGHVQEYPRPSSSSSA